MVPYSDSATLVIPWNIPPAGVNIGGFEEFPWSPIHFQALEQETKTFRFLGAFQGSNFNLTESGDPVMLEGALVSWGFFPALGVSPELGRTFTHGEDTPGHEHVAVLSDALWRSRFHGDPSILVADDSTVPDCVTVENAAGQKFPVPAALVDDVCL